MDPSTDSTWHDVSSSWLCMTPFSVPASTCPKETLPAVLLAPLMTFLFLLPLQITQTQFSLWILGNMRERNNNPIPVQFSSVSQSCPTLCDPMNRSTPGLPVHHQLPEFIQTHVHRVSDAIQPSHPLSSPSPPAPNPSQHHSLFQRVNSLHEVAKILEFQL